MVAVVVAVVVVVAVAVAVAVVVAVAVAVAVDLMGSSSMNPIILSRGGKVKARKLCPFCRET